MSIVLLYITVASREKAKTLAALLLEERLIACANIHGPVTSLYRWEGAVQEAEEVVLIAKTRQALVEQVSARVAAWHDYDCPCIVALPVEGGHAPFLRWVAEETGG